MGRFDFAQSVGRGMKDWDERLGGERKVKIEREGEEERKEGKEKEGGRTGEEER